MHSLLLYISFRRKKGCLSHCFFLHALICCLQELLECLLKIADQGMAAVPFSPSPGALASPCSDTCGRERYTIATPYDKEAELSAAAAMRDNLQL